jgi:hypothetical protein
MPTITFDVPKVAANAKIAAIAEQAARNLISLFADEEDHLQQAIAESDGDKTTLNHAITLDLAKHKQTDKLSYSIKRGDEITMTIPDPDQRDLFEPLHGKASTEPFMPSGPEAEPPEKAELVGLPAPVLGLPAPAEEIQEAEVFEDESEEESEGL